MTETTDDVRERPILFNGWSVPRIFDDQKTQTRRILDDDVQDKIRALNGETTAPKVRRGIVDPSPLCFFYSEDGHSGEGVYVSLEEYPSEGAFYLGSPKYYPGDVLWVRESFRLPWDAERMSPSEFVGQRLGYIWKTEADDQTHIQDGWTRISTGEERWGRKRPSIFMPRELCRLRLRVKNVRFERIQEISHEDALKEGIAACDVEETPPHRIIVDGQKCGTAKDAFAVLWDSIHGEGAWERNDWVRVTEFSRLPTAT